MRDSEHPKPDGPRQEGLTRRDVFERAVWIAPVILTVGLSPRAFAHFSPVGRCVGDSDSDSDNSDSEWTLGDSDSDSDCDSDS